MRLPAPKTLATLRAALGACGVALLGAALAWAPVAAFHDDMAIVSKLGIAGAVLVLVAWLLPKAAATGDSEDEPGEGR